MKPNQLKYILVLFFPLLLSCHKDAVTNSESVVGKWEWIKSVENPWTGLVTNPQTAGYSKTLEFSSNGTMKEYKDGLQISTSTYSIESNNGSILSSTIITSHYYFVNDTLIFSEASVDGPSYYYIRIK